MNPLRRGTGAKWVRFEAILRTMQLEQVRDRRLLFGAAGLLLLLLGGALIDGFGHRRRQAVEAESCKRSGELTTLEEVWVARAGSPLTLVSGETYARGAGAAVFRPWGLEIRGPLQQPEGGSGSGLDWYWILAGFFCQVVFLATYDTVCGERERGTLRLVLVSSRGRGGFLFGRVAALFGFNLLVAALGALAALAAAALLGTVSSYTDLARACAAAVLVGAFLLVVVGLGALCSTVSPDSQSALARVLVVWVVLALIIPASIPALAEAMERSGASLDEVRQAEGRAYLRFADAVTVDSSMIQDLVGDDALSPAQKRAILERREAEIRRRQERSIAAYEQEIGEIRSSYLDRRLAVLETARRLRFVSPFAILQDGLGIVACSGNYGTLRFVRHVRSQEAGMTAALLRERRSKRSLASEQKASVWDSDSRGDEYRLDGLVGLSYAALKPDSPLGGCAEFDEYCPLDERTLHDTIGDLLGLTLWGVVLLGLTIRAFETCDVR